MEKEKNKIFKNSLVVAILILFLLSSGCIPVQSATHVKAFSLATTELSDQMVQVYELVDKSTIDRKIFEIALFTNDEVEGLNDKDIDNIKGIFSGEKKNATSIKAINALKSYTKAIGDLSSADFREDIDKASKDLYGSFVSLEETYKELAGEELGVGGKDFALSATLINAIGKTVIEVKRRRAIKEIVIETGPFVNKVCDEISANIGENEDIIRENFFRIYVAKINSYKKGILNGEITGLEEKAENIKELVAYSKVYNKSETLFDDIKKAVGKVKKTHNTLYESVKKDKFTTPELAKEIGDLVSFSEEMKIFYESLLNPSEVKK